MPTPNSCCQNRFTATRAVSGCSADTNHSARSMRVFGPVLVLQRGQEGGRIALDLFAGIVVCAANEDVGGPYFGLLFHDHAIGNRGLERLFLGLNFLESLFQPASAPRSSVCFCRFVAGLALQACSIFARAVPSLRSILRSSSAASPLRFGRQTNVRRLQPALEVRPLAASGFRRGVEVVEEGKELVKILRRDRIVLVVVADGALHRQAHEGGADGRDPIDDIAREALFGKCRSAIDDQMQPIESGGDELVVGRLRDRGRRQVGT